MSEKTHKPPNGLVAEPRLRAANECLDALQQELTSAKSKFTGGADHDSDLVAAAHSLNAVIKYLQAVGIDAENIWPLGDLLGAIVNVTEGRENPLFAPRKPSHRPGRSITREAPLALASATISLLIEGEKMSEEEAARKVARVFEAHKYELPGTKHSNQNSWKTIAEWRLKLRQGKRGSELLQIYSDAKKSAHKNSESNPAEALLEVLDKLYGEKKA